ncbi:uncharacterized protein LOC120125386 [Hibiscus syriacus]|uniref:uncharacterized protein LOC120125386 n=1 Tax=Hibiscus syriacus TaxID=106335 RepID=UPI0019249780|nr:uncharacterized protein LOC120125386 [Hibiscus syriacus]
MKHMDSRMFKQFSEAKYRRMRRRRTAHSGGGRSVRMKVKRLQKLIPGGKGMQPDRLFLRTADYIQHLQLQVHILQALSKVYQPSIGLANGVHELEHPVAQSHENYSTKLLKGRHQRPHPINKFQRQKDVSFSPSQLNTSKATK